MAQPATAVAVEDRRYVPSLITATGIIIIEQDMIETGLIAAPKPFLAQVAPPAGTALQ